MANTSTSKILNKVKKTTKGAWKRSRNKPATVKGQQLPGGIVGGVARFKSYNIGESEDGTPYVSLTGIVHEPEECRGFRASVSHRFKETERKTVEDICDDFASNLQLLGADTDGTTEDDWEDLLKGLAKDQPFFRFNTKAWEFNGRSGVSVYIQGTAEDYEPEEPEEEVVDDDSSSEASDETEADDSDTDASSSDAPFSGINVGDKVVVNNPDEDYPWTGTILSISGDQAEVEAVEDGNPYYEPVSALEPLSDDIDSLGDPDDDEDDASSEDWVPEAGDVYLFQPPRAKAPTECEVKAVDEDDKTVDLVRLDDGKEFAGIPWAKLEGSE